MLPDDLKRLTTPVVKDVFRLDGHDVPVEVPKVDESGWNLTKGRKWIESKATKV